MSYYPPWQYGLYSLPEPYWNALSAPATCPVFWFVTDDCPYPDWAGKPCTVADPVPDSDGDLRVTVDGFGRWLKARYVRSVAQHQFHNNGCQRARCDVCGHMGQWDWRRQIFV